MFLGTRLEVSWTGALAVGALIRLAKNTVAIRRCFDYCLLSKILLATFVKKIDIQLFPIIAIFIVSNESWIWREKLDFGSSKTWYSNDPSILEYLSFRIWSIREIFHGIWVKKSSEKLMKLWEIAISEDSGNNSKTERKRLTWVLRQRHWWSCKPDMDRCQLVVVVHNRRIRSISPWLVFFLVVREEIFDNWGPGHRSLWRSPRLRPRSLETRSPRRERPNPNPTISSLVREDRRCPSRPMAHVGHTFHQHRIDQSDYHKVTSLALAVSP